MAGAEYTRQAVLRRPRHAERGETRSNASQRLALTPLSSERLARTRRGWRRYGAAWAWTRVLSSTFV
jgi:hypothetical protein